MEHFDVVIVGSGVGGGTVARALADTGARILILERGDFIPVEAENWMPRAVWKERRYRAKEVWHGIGNEELVPYTHYCVGGNSKFWGSTLFRLRAEDFGEMRHVDGMSPAWPIDYETLAPYYDRAEAWYHVHGRAGLDPTEPPRGPYPHAPLPYLGRLKDTVERLQEQGLHPFPQPLGLVGPHSADGCILCNTCNSFPCQLRAKGDADVCGVSPALDRASVTLWTNAYAERIRTGSGGQRATEVEVVRDGEQVRVGADLFIVSCGAINSAALLLRSKSREHPAGLANSSGLVGRRYMAHLATNLSRFQPPAHERLFAKTIAINDFYFGGDESDYPLGGIQTNGRTAPELARYILTGWPRLVPRRVFDIWLSRSIEWLVLSEDLPDPENRVTVDDDGRIRLEWRPSNSSSHHQLVRIAGRMLRKVGGWVTMSGSMGSANTTHQCGTAVFGTDPASSVLDPFCRAHDVDNLFVVDASFFPSSGAVNPGLTIAAQAIRTADHIRDTLLN